MLKRGSTCLVESTENVVPHKRHCLPSSKASTHTLPAGENVYVGKEKVKNTKKTGRRVLGDIGNQLPPVTAEVVEKEKETVRSGCVQESQIVPVKAPMKLSAIDENFKHDALYASVYAEQIIDYMRSQEEIYCVPSNFLKHQSEVTARMRSILVDWIVEVHHRFKLSQQTLFLAVNLLDRYVAVTPVPKKKLQLVGVTALWIASKFEDVYQPELRDFEFVTDKACSKQEMLNMEGKMLEALDFKLIVPTAVLFLPRFLQVVGVEAKSFVANMASFFLECTLGEVEFCGMKASLVATAALYLARKACKASPHWTPDMEAHTKYSQCSVRVPAKALCGIVNNLHKSSYQAVRIKYSSERYKKVAKEVVAGPVPSASTAGRVPSKN